MTAVERSVSASFAGIAWLEADKKLPNNDAETPGTHGWRIRGAVTTTALGCATSKTPSFSVATATKDAAAKVGS